MEPVPCGVNIQAEDVPMALTATNIQELIIQPYNTSKSKLFVWWEWKQCFFGTTMFNVLMYGCR